jgi:hypothetical protein
MPVPTPTPNHSEPVHETVRRFFTLVAQMMRMVVPPQFQFALIAWDGNGLVGESTDPDPKRTADAMRKLAMIYDPPNKA